MTIAFPSEWDIPDVWWVWALLALLPVMLAAGAMDRSAPGMTLPDEQSYKTPLSDALFESSDWRKSPQPEADWRQPRSSSSGWRTESTPKSDIPSSQRNRTLFPRYQPGNPNDFDPINREYKPQIKVFEFGS